MKSRHQDKGNIEDRENDDVSKTQGRDTRTTTRARIKYHKGRDG